MKKTLKNKFFFPIVLKVSLFSMLTLFVVIFASSYYLKQESDKTINAMIKQQFTQALSMAENHLELLGQVNIILINEIAEDHEFLEYIGQKEHHKLHEFIADKRYDIQCDQLIVLDKDTNIITQSGSIPFKGNQLNSIKIVSDTLKSKISYTTIIRQYDVFVLYASAPIIVNNKLHGTVLMGFSINDTMMQNIKQKTVMEFTIVGDRAIAATSLKHENHFTGGNIPIGYMDYLWLLKYPDKYYKATIGSKEYYLTARPLKNMDAGSSASFMMAYPSDAINVYEENILDATKLTLFVALIFSFIVITLFALKIRDIFKKMLAQTQEIKEGKYNKELELHTNDEFEILSKNFNILSKSLKRQNKIIVDYTNSLEKKVEIRTQELNDQKKSLEYILDLHTSMILKIDTQNILYANKIFLNFFGIESIENKEGLCELFELEDDLCNNIKSIKDIIESLFYKQKQISLKDKEGEQKIFNINFITVDAGKDQKVVIFNDVTQLIHENKRLEQQAFHDHLTGQYNRLKFNEELEKSLYMTNRYQEFNSLVICDIDNFKQINDTYGHIVGDYALVTLTDIFSKRIRTSDILARWGGEEFIILLNATNEQEAELFANSLRESLNNYTFEHFGKMTCSFGVTELIKGDSINDAIDRVDAALYHSKKNGKDMVSVK